MAKTNSIQVKNDKAENGLPIIQLEMPGTRSVTFLLAFDAGSRTETREENGMAHFLEHLVFKGGEKYPNPKALNEKAERIGARLNAYTSHDLVAFHITARSEVITDMIDLLTDFVGRPQIDPGALERERGVVVQEIARMKDDPASLAYELLEQATFGDHPLGRPVLGPAENIKNFPREAFFKFRRRRWSPANGGAFIAGNLSHLDQGQTKELLSRFESLPNPPEYDPAPKVSRNVLIEHKDTNQSHLRLWWDTPIRHDNSKEAAVFRVYSSLLGGSMGSRLFDEIREQRGLCYHIGSSTWFGADSSGLYVASGLESSKCIEAYERICEIVDELATKGPAKGELERARAFTSGNRILALEDTEHVARTAAYNKVVHNEIDSPDEIIEEIDSVTEEEVKELASRIKGKPVVACIGPHKKEDFN